MWTTLSDDHPFAKGIRALFGGALTIFVITVGIGILNGMDIVDFDHKTLMGHVHSGTLGWISLSVFAASMWLFGKDDSPGPLVRALLITLAIGAVLGILLGLWLADKIDFLPDGAYDAHPATMVVGFLIPMGMALAECGEARARAVSVGR